MRGAHQSDKSTLALPATVADVSAETVSGSELPVDRPLSRRAGSALSFLGSKGIVGVTDNALVVVDAASLRFKSGRRPISLNGDR